MEKELKNNINDKINYLKKKIMILEWDKDKNQLNPGKVTYLEKIKKEVLELEKQIANENNKQKEVDNEKNKNQEKLINNEKKEESESNE